MREMNRYPLSALRAVEAAGRLGTLSKASDALGVTPGAISQHIRRVEKQVGRALFERTPRGLAPTPSGAALLHSLSVAFRDIARALQEAEGGNECALTVSVAPVLASKWLVPRLTGFHEANPKIRLRIDATSELIDFDVSDVEVGVRGGKGPWPRTRAEKLAELRLFPVCSPKIARRITTLEDLAAIPSIVDYGSPKRWSQWLCAHGAPDLKLARGPTYSDAGLCLEAAIAGQGVAMAWSTLAMDALRSGLIRSPFPAPLPSGEYYWLVSRTSGALGSEGRSFARWIRRKLLEDIGGGEM
jgi:DNA-binding transcriptional LysR family regulator